MCDMKASDEDERHSHYFDLLFVKLAGWLRDGESRFDIEPIGEFL